MSEVVSATWVVGYGGAPTNTVAVQINTKTWMVRVVDGVVKGGGTPGNALAEWLAAGNTISKAP